MTDITGSPAVVAGADGGSTQVTATNGAAPDPAQDAVAQQPESTTEPAEVSAGSGAADDAVGDGDGHGDAAESGSADAGSDDQASGDGGSGDEAHDELVAEGDAAGDYLERLLDILDFDGDIDLDVEGERAVVSIIGDGDIEKLVGDHGQVLDALQELTRLAAGMETGQRSRLMLDIAGYRARRRAELAELGRETATRVVASGSPIKLGAMNPFERKVVHDAVATVDGATSSSEGVEPHRRVVVTPSA